MSTSKRSRRPAPRPAVPRPAGRGPAGPRRTPGDEPVVVRVGRPPELVAALPPMLGFVPEESVVLLGMHGDERRRVGGMVRVDLGPDADEDAGRLLSAALCDRLAPSRPDAVIAVVVCAVASGDDPGDDGDPGPLGPPPHARLVARITEEFAGLDVPMIGAVWAARIAEGAPWRCYDPCACTGTLPDPGGTVAAAASIAAGKVTYGSRDDVEAALAPHPAASGRRRRDLVDDAREAAVVDRQLSGRDAARRDLDAVRRAAAEVGAGGVLTEEEIARLAVALRDPAVRDVCLGFAAGHDRAVEPAHAQQLWTLLTRAVPAPEVAEPATLLAFATLDHGGGATLSVALDRAMTADPEHQLSRLLGQVLMAGIDPAATREMVAGASGEALARLTA